MPKFLYVDIGDGLSGFSMVEEIDRERLSVYVSPFEITEERKKELTKRMLKDVFGSHFEVQNKVIDDYLLGRLRHGLKHEVFEMIHGRYDLQVDEDARIRWREKFEAFIPGENLDLADFMVRKGIIKKVKWRYF